MFKFYFLLVVVFVCLFLLKIKRKKIDKALFLINKNEITFKNKSYCLTSIRHISFSITKIIQRQNYMKVGEPRIAVLEVVFDDESKIKLEIDERSFLFGLNNSLDNHINELYAKYNKLLKLTSENRYEKYLKEVELYHFFKYDGVYWFPEGKLKVKNKFYNIKDYNVSKRDKILFFKKKKAGLFNNMEFELSFDSDIILKVFNNFFKWDFK